MLEQGDQVTAEFLLTRGDYVWIGWGWGGGHLHAGLPRASEFDRDYGGRPAAPCTERDNGTGVFTREYPKATVEWNCNTGRGEIRMKDLARL